MSDTPLLGLPLMAAAQAQKHVTHNEALMMLDSLVQLAVPTRSLSEPPAAAAVGARYLVAAPGTGDWAGHAGHIALRDEGAWRFLVPAAGWRLWVSDEKLHLVFEGGVWQAVPVAGPVQNIPLLGVATTANDDNRLAVAAANTLLTHAGGDHRLKINKAAVANTASLLFQDNWSGRAEMGLAGDDHFHLKVSADGAVWREALTIDAATGKLVGNGVLTPGDTDRIAAVQARFPMRWRGGNLLAVDCLAAAIVSGAVGSLALTTLNAGLSQLTSAAGASLISRKRRLELMAANSLRPHFLGDGTAAGLLIEPAATILNKYSQQSVALLTDKANVADTPPPSGSGRTGTWWDFADNTLARYAYGRMTPAGNTTYNIQAEVIVADGDVPTTTDLSFDLFEPAQNIKNPDTGVQGFRVEGPYAGGVYHLSACVTTAATPTYTVYGVQKRSIHSARRVRVGRINVSEGRYPPSFFDNATGAAVTRAGDVLTMPVSGFTSDEMTLAVEFIAPPPAAAPRTLAVLAAGAGERLVLAAAAGAATVTASVTAGGVLTGSAVSSAMVAGSRCRAVAVIDQAARKIKTCVTGGAVVEGTVSTVPAAPTTLMLGHSDGAAQLNSGLLAAGVVDRAWSSAEMLAWVLAS